MKRKIYSYLVLSIGIIVSITSCKKFVGGDVNIDPNKASTPTLNILLPTVIEATTDNHYRVAVSTSLFAQQIAAYTSGSLNEDQNKDARLSLAYIGIYQNALTNLDVMVKLAAQQNAPHYIGIGKVLQAVNLALAADVWGDVPFSEAFQGAANLYPNFDKQQDVYTNIQKLLDDAIAALAQPAGQYKPSTDDLVYGVLPNGKANVNNQVNWTKAAWALKARYAMHLTKKGNTQAAQNALSYITKGLASNDDDCQLVYNSRNISPWNKNISVLISSGNFRIAPSQKMMDAMNGTLYPGIFDPRLPILVDKKSNAQFRGILNGTGAGGTTDLTELTFFGRQNAPVFIITYAEQKFIEAEAAFIQAGGTTSSIGSSPQAYAAYTTGIAANMTKLSVPTADMNTYVNNPLVAVTAGGLSLEHILREKFVATFLHPEAWVDVRRYDYSPSLYKGIALPQNQDPAMGGQFIRRSYYPLEVLNRNPKAGAAEKTLTSKVWWDQ